VHRERPLKRESLRNADRLESLIGKRGSDYGELRDSVLKVREFFGGSEEKSRES
jgi:hypothetical protein